jgi:hypothetical protein
LPTSTSLDKDLAQALAESYPPLARYWPNLPKVSEPQALFLLLDDLEAFYGGAAGGGKSDALLAAALQYIDTPGYAALILRRTFRQLDQPDAIMARSKEWLMNTDARWSDDAKRWTFPSSATLTFGYLDSENDVYNYQGPAYQFVGWDELTQFTEKQYTYLFSRTRRRKDLAQAGVPIRHRSASNPGGIGHTWVKDRFPVAAKSPTRSDKGRVFIPAKVGDNPGLDVDEYKLSLAELDDTLRAQLLDGDWGVFEGAAFSITPAHLVASFPLDSSMERFEAADYGLNGAPWACWAVDYDGNLVCFDLIYERDKLPSELTPLILEKRRVWGSTDAYVDPSIWHRTGTLNRWGAPAVLADEFDDNGVRVTRANNDPRAGLVRLRELLRQDPEHRFPAWHPRSGEPGAPRLFFTPATSRVVEELRAAPLQPIEKRDGGEIIDPAWESRHGHAVAMSRYAAMTLPEPSTEPPAEELTDDELRIRFMERVRENRDKTSTTRYINT